MSKFRVPLIRRDTGKIDPKFLTEPSGGGGEPAESPWGHYYIRHSYQAAGVPGPEGLAPVSAPIPGDSEINPSEWPSSLPAGTFTIPETGLYVLAAESIATVQDGAGAPVENALNVSAGFRVGSAFTIMCSTATYTSSGEVSYSSYTSAPYYSLQRFTGGDSVSLEASVSRVGGPRPDLTGYAMISYFAISRVG